MTTSTERDLIPVIDIGRADPDPGRRRRVAAEIDRACREVGFFAIAGHDVAPRLIDDAYRALREFFYLPAEDKLRCLADPADPLMRGFGREGSLGASRPDADTGSARALPDLSETWTMNVLGEPGPPRLPDGADPNLLLPNLWPDLAGFDAALRAYYRAMEGLADHLLELFALALGLEPDWFAGRTDRHMSNMTANWYPAQPDPPAPGQLRKGEHSDWGSLTILYQDGAPGGLQARTTGGGFVDVPAVPGTFVINIGDLMARWTNDVWVSTRHHVVNPPREAAATDRFSIPFFHQPNHDALIECIPTCAGPDEPWYPPVSSGAHITEMFRRSYGE